MECPKCRHHNTAVIDSRDVEHNSVRRRRECETCRYRFTTYEKAEPVKFMVAKKDGKVEPYQRQKMIRGMRIAIEKRGIGDEILEEVADRIEQKIISQNQDSVPTTKIGDLVVKELRQLDEIAYLRFTSVYKEFKTRRSFEKELAKLNDG